MAYALLRDRDVNDGCAGVGGLERLCRLTRDGLEELLRVPATEGALGLGHDDFFFIQLDGVASISELSNGEKGVV